MNVPLVILLLMFDQACSFVNVAEHLVKPFQDNYMGNDFLIEREVKKHGK